jgi:hypothetical protein
MLFQEASIMVEEAWKVAYPSLRFPSEWIGAFPQAAKKKGSRDVQLGNGVIVLDVPNIYEIVFDSDLARFRRERGLVIALKYVLDQKSNQPSQHIKHLLAAFAASHPQILVIYQELLIALSRYTFLLEVTGCVEDSGKAKGISRINETKPPNYRQRKRGEDLLPRLLGYFPYKPMGLKASVTELERELEAPEISFDRRLTVTGKQNYSKKTNRVAWRRKLKSNYGLAGTLGQASSCLQRSSS